MEMRKYDSAIINCLPYDIKMVSLNDVAAAEERIPETPNKLAIFNTKVSIDSSNIIGVDTIPSIRNAFSYNVDDKISCAFLDVRCIVKTLRDKYHFTKGDVNVMVAPEVAPYVKQSVLNNSDIHIISPVLKAYDENNKFRGYLGRVEIMGNNEESEDF